MSPLFGRSARAAEARLDDLSGGAPGQRGHDRDLAGVLEGGEPLPAVEDERARVGVGAGSEGDEGVDLLAGGGGRTTATPGPGAPGGGGENAPTSRGEDGGPAAQDRPPL